MHQILWIYSRYWFLASLFTFLLFALDKLAAIRHRYRIPEKTLLRLAFFGGAPGAILAMILCRHKIRKPRFRSLIPLFLFFQVLLWAYLSGQLFG